jgi:hypothetical protein
MRSIWAKNSPKGRFAVSCGRGFGGLRTVLVERPSPCARVFQGLHQSRYLHSHSSHERILDPHTLNLPSVQEVLAVKGFASGFQS